MPRAKTIGAGVAVIFATPPIAAAFYIFFLSNGEWSFRFEFASTIAERAATGGDAGDGPSLHLSAGQHAQDNRDPTKALIARRIVVKGEPC